MMRFFLLLVLLLGFTTSSAFAAPSIEKSMQHDTVGNLIVGMPMPDFASVELSQAHLEVLGLEDMMREVNKIFDIGHPVLVFFSTSCVPCRTGLQLMRDNAEELKKSGAVVWLVALGDDRATVRKFLKAMRLEFPTIHDPDGRVASRYGVMGKGGTMADAKIPLTVLGSNSAVVRKFISAEGKDYLKLVQESRK